MYPVPPAVVAEVVRLLPRGASSVVCFYTIVFSSELTLDDDRRKAQPRHVQPTSTEILGIENVIIMHDDVTIILCTIVCIFT